MSIEKMAKKANELREKGHANREISQEMHLSEATVEWLLAREASKDFTGQLPPDVKVGWRTIGVSGSRISSIAEIMADVILEEQEKREFDFDMIAGVTNNGVPSNLHSCISYQHQHGNISTYFFKCQFSVHIHKLSEPKTHLLHSYTFYRKLLMIGSFRNK